jgi:uncharacterized protein (TIGR02265 family)
VTRAAPPLAEPHALGARVRDTREATRDLWGDAVVAAVLAALPDAGDRALFAGASYPLWVPERAFADWMQAVWDGPAARDAAQLARWVDRLTDRGFGTAKRALMSLASPWVILRRAGSLWRTEHSHGELAVTPLGRTEARFELRGHPFADSEVAAAAISEAYRYIVFRCRTRWATEDHAREPAGTLAVTVRWG